MKQLKFVFIGTIITIVALLLTGCSSSKTSVHDPLITPAISPISIAKKKLSENIKISPQEAQEMLTEDVIILDIRTQEEYDEGHIANSILLPNNQIQEKAETVITDKKQKILVYSQTGIRSEHVAKELIDMGYEMIYDLGGLVNWTGEIVGHWLYPSYYNYFGGTLPPAIITPIDFTTSKKISNQMQEFKFHLTGNNVKNYGVTDNNTKYYIMFDENKIENITITDNTGKLVQKIENLITANPATEEEMYGLSFADWNFDGYLDIDLWSYRGGSMLNEPHYYWLWDNNMGQFVMNAELMEISDFSTIVINVEESRLESYKRLGGLGGVTQHFKYIDDKLVLVYSYVLEVVPSTDDDKYTCHITISEFIDGEMIITEDFYEEN